MKAETPSADAAAEWGAVEEDPEHLARVKDGGEVRASDVDTSAVDPSVAEPPVDEEEWCCDVAGPGCVRLSGPLCPEWSVCHVCASRQPGAVGAEGV